jgi:hypothetical protein
MMNTSLFSLSLCLLSSRYSATAWGDALTAT